MEIRQRIIEKLRQTHTLMVSLTEQLLQRGNSVERLEERTEQVLRTSELFMFRVIPWHQRLLHRVKRLFFCPRWWFFCCSNCAREDATL